MDVVIATAVIIIAVTVINIIIIRVGDGQEFGSLGAEVSGNREKQDLYLGRGLMAESLQIKELLEKMETFDVDYRELSWLRCPGYGIFYRMHFISHPCSETN